LGSPMPSRRIQSVARVGIEPTVDHQGLSLAALPVCVPCRRASPMGFEPMFSTLTGWRALQAAPRGQDPVAQVGVEPTASLVLSEGGRPGCLPGPKLRGLESNQRLLVQSQASLPAATAPESAFFSTQPQLRSSGRRSRTFMSSFKDCRPTISRSPRVPGGNQTRLAGLEDRRLRRLAKGTKRKERESNPQGSALGRFQDGCHRQLACPSDRTAAAGIEPAIVSLTGSRLTIRPHRKKSGRWGLNPRFPVPETGGFPGFPTS
jgi:hypothetical protein